MQEALILTAIVSSWPEIISQIDKPNERMCIEAVKGNGMNLRYIKEEYQTPTVCLNAVRNNGAAIQFIVNKKKIIDRSLAEVACRRNGEAIFYVPYTVIDDELLLTAAQNMFKRKFNGGRDNNLYLEVGSLYIDTAIRFHKKMFPSSPFFIEQEKVPVLPPHRNVPLIRCLNHNCPPLPPPIEISFL